MAIRCYRAESRVDYHKARDENFTCEELRTGSLLRIADAVEKMAGNYTVLKDEVTCLKESRDRIRKCNDYLHRSNAALRGYIKRFKKERKR